MTFIYGLTDPRTGEVRYVGKADHPERRVGEHLKAKDPCHRVHWLQELKCIHLLTGLVTETVPPEAVAKAVGIFQAGALTMSPPPATGRNTSADDAMTVKDHGTPPGQLTPTDRGS